MTVCKKLISVLLAVMMLFTLFVPSVSAIYQQDFVIVSGDEIKVKWYKWAYFMDSGVSAHYIDKNKNGKADPIEFLICLQRDMPSGSNVSDKWTGVTTMEKTEFWRSLSYEQRESIIRTLLHGYPNTTTYYGIKGVNKWEALYATKILVWEFATGAREPDDFTVYARGPKAYAANTEMGKYELHKAFITNKDINDYNNSNFVEMTCGTVDGKQMFKDAFAYYKKLLNAVANHTSKPEFSDINFGKNAKRSGDLFTFAGKGTYTATNSMFSQFTFKSSDKSVATVSLSGNTLTVKVLKDNVEATITATKKNTNSNYYDKSGNLTPAVMIQSGAGKQILMWGTGSLADPVRFAFNVKAIPQKGGIGVLKVSHKGEPLQNVTFGVYSTKSDATNRTNEVTTLTTDARGTAHYGGTSVSKFSLKAGTTYYVRETKTITGYELDDKIYSVKVTGNAVTYVGNNGNSSVFYEDNPSSIIYTKGVAIVSSFAGIDAENNSLPFPGVKCEVYNADTNTLIHTGTTKQSSDISDANYGVNGKKTLSESALTPGNYYLKIISASGTYKEQFNCKAKIPFTVEANRITHINLYGNSYVVNNLADKGAIGLSKLDESGNAISYNPIFDMLLGSKTYSTFGIYSDEACLNELAELKTTPGSADSVYGVDSSGRFTLPADKTYYVKEKTAPKGLVPIEKVYSVYVEAGKVNYVNTTDTFTELVKDGSNHNGGLKLVPTSKRSDVTDVTVTFTLYGDQTDYDFNGDGKTSEEELANSYVTKSGVALNSTVEFYGPKKTGTSVPTTKNKSNLVAGKENIIASVVWTYSDGTTTSRVFGFPVIANTIIEHRIDDASGISNYDYGGFKVIKVDSLNNNPIESVAFGVFSSYSKAKSATINGTGDIATLVTDENGEAYLPYEGENGKIVPYTESNKQFYYLRELSAPDWCEVKDDIYPVMLGYVDGTYVMNKSDGTFKFVSDEVYEAQYENNDSYIKVQETIKKSSGVIGGVINSSLETKSGYATVYAENDVECSVRVVKHCELGAEGFEFKIVDLAGNVVKNLADEDMIGVTVADEEDPTVGYIEFNRLSYNSDTLFLVETEQEGYSPVNTQSITSLGKTIKYCQEIEFFPDNNVEIEVTNTPRRGSLTIQKTVDKGSAEGWQFAVEGTFFDGSIIDDIYTTDADGKIVLTGLLSGEVTVTELRVQEKEEYNGYYCDGEYTRTITLDWTSDDESKNVEFVDYSNILRRYKIRKTDMYGYPLAGVEFTVYGTEEDAKNNAESSVVLVTDENGWAYFDGFGEDVYYIKETKTLDGYMLSPEIRVLNNTMGEWKNTATDKADWECINYLITVVHTGVDGLNSRVSFVVASLGLFAGAVGYFYKKKQRKPKFNTGD